MDEKLLSERYPQSYPEKETSKDFQLSNKSILDTGAKESTKQFPRVYNIKGRGKDIYA